MQVLRFHFAVLLIVAASILLVHADRMTLTPFGYMPASCVHGVENNAHILSVDADQNMHVRLEDGTMKAIPPCHTNEHVISRAVTRSRRSKDVTLPNGWAAYASWDSPSEIVYFNGGWTCPPVPSEQSVQTLFLFTGLQNAFDLAADPAATVSIIQPVLQWGPSEAGGGNYWAIASWYVTSTGSAVYSTLITVSPGDAILGNMTVSNAKWDISTIQAKTNRATSIKVNPQATELWAFVTLEVYNVGDCGDYPNGSTVFSNLDVRGSSGPVTPSWGTTAQPGCSEAVQIANAKTVVVKF